MEELKNFGYDVSSKEKLIPNLYNLMNKGKFERVIVISNLNQSELLHWKTGVFKPGAQRLELKTINSDLAKRYKDESGLRIDYNFDEFKVGPWNFFAHSAAYAVATNPSKIFNPLYIYGISAAGKTHLLNAIGNLALLENPTMGVIYWNAGMFESDLIEAYSSDYIRELHGKDSRSKLLLLDDIQKLQGNTEAQNELLYIFNELLNEKNQIDLACDRKPSDLKDIDERLVSRFQMGVITNIDRQV